VVSVATRAIFGRYDSDQIVTEVVAQIRKIQNAGITVSHLDSHKHTHIFPAVLHALVKAAKICGVGAIRNPFVPAILLSPALFAKQPGLWKRYGQVRILRSFAAGFRDKMNRAGIATPDGIVGVIETGSVDASMLRRALADLPDGIWELV